MNGTNSCTLPLCLFCFVRCTGESEQRSAGGSFVPAPWRLFPRGESPPGMDVLKRRIPPPLQDDPFPRLTGHIQEKKILLLLLAIGRC